MSFPNENNRSKVVIGVDDNAANLMILKAYVGNAGYAFIGVANGEECLDLATRVVPRVILLDIEMPGGIDGLETCRRLIVFLTAHKTAEYVMAGMAAGGNDFIAKPVDKDKLYERLAHWTSRRIASVV
jgi:two-component system OmpR family response regulator